MRVLALSTAFIWALTVSAVIMIYHRPGHTSVWEEIQTPGQPTRFIYGTSPAQTLLEHDPAGAVIIWVALSLAMLAGAASLVLRLRTHRDSYRYLALVAGCMLVAFSVFGLLWGVLGLGTVGALVALSSRALPADAGRGPVAPV